MAQKPKSIGECTENKTDSKILLTENRMKMTFLNRERKVVKVVTIDNCVVTEGIRCDYLVINEKDNEFFVELKGTDIRHACDQLTASIKQLSTNPKQKPKHSFVVCSRFSPAINTIVQNQKVLFKSRFNCKLIIKRQQCEFELQSY